MEQQAIDRDTYRQIKKLSREELNDFLIRYAENLCIPIDLRDMEKEIRAISGMGEKRTELVMNIIEKYLGDVYYENEKNVVLVCWKSYCELEQYRTPLEYALRVIVEHPGCNYAADTRNGFEDNPADTKWVAEYFMPQARKNGCRIIWFIIDRNNSLKEELEGQQRDSASIMEFRYVYSLDEISE